MSVREKTRTSLSGVWHNQHASEVHFEIDQTGDATGFFKTGVGANQQPSEMFRLRGFASEDMISFCVDFSKYGCMTSWVGQLSGDNSDSLVAMWHMMVTTHKQPGQIWKAVWTGQDFFESGPAKEFTGYRTTAAASHPPQCSVPNKQDHLGCELT